jgi:hypothetical protein
MVKEYHVVKAVVVSYRQALYESLKCCQRRFTGGFSFTKDTTAAKIGPIELKVQERESVNIPQWLSLGVLALGGIVLVLGFRKP